jgi:serine protease Do
MTNPYNHHNFNDDSTPYEEIYEKPYAETPLNAQNPKKGFRKRSTALLVAGCLIVGGLSGFGGSILANRISGESAAVMYKTVGHTETTSTKSSSSKNGTLTTEQVAKTASPTVVSITTESKETSSIYSDLVTKGAGSGVILTKDGYIVTCAHVVDDATTIKVKTSNNKEYTAKVVGSDSQTDIALIKISASNLTPAVIGKSSELDTGETAVAIGNPLGELSGTVTEGIISAKERQISISGQKMTLIQTSAQVNPGNSGGGLFNQYGELVGIVESKSSGSDVEGLGFAVPIDTATKVIESLKADGYVKGRPSLGITIADATSAQSAMRYGAGQTGVVITGVTQNSAADQAGLQTGDIITAVSGKKISEAADVTAAVQKKSVGDKIKITISRDGSSKTVTVTLKEATKNTSSSSSANASNNANNDDEGGGLF